jgi:hypothetical protein
LFNLFYLAALGACAMIGLLLIAHFCPLVSPFSSKLSFDDPFLKSNYLPGVFSTEDTSSGGHDDLTLTY